MPSSSPSDATWPSFSHSEPSCLETGPVNGFQRSHVIASIFKGVTLASVDPTNGGTKFGVIAGDAIQSLTVAEPQRLRFDPTNLNPQGFGDFEVKIV